MLYVHKHKATFPCDDECRRTQYDDRGFHEAHDTRGSAGLRTSLQISDQKGSRGCPSPPRDLHSHVWVVCREVLHIHSCPRLEATPRWDRYRFQEHDCMCLHLHGLL